jgi:hypothetical protein
MTTTIKELAKTTGIAISELAAKAGELGFKGGTNAQLPEDIEKQLANTKTVNSTNGNGNGNGNFALSTNNQTIDLSNPNLEEELKVATAIGIAKADLLLEAQRQAFEQRYGEGEEEMADYIISLYGEYQGALNSLQASRPPRKRQSISEKFAELQAQIAKK